MEQKQNKGKKIVVLVIAFFMTIVVSGVVGATSILVVFHYNPDLVRNTVTNITKTEKEVTVNENGIADAVAKVYDSVVIVKNYQKNQLYATGTGFFYKKENNTYYLLTNYHVIQNGEKISVVLTSGEEEEVTVEGGDKYSDIAVLSFQTEKDIAVAELGDNTSTRVGDTVFAIGAPLDSSVYSWSVTRGILSGKDREVKVSTTNSNSSDWIMRVIQTDTAINSGNSGGPLCNSNGQVIGITNMKLASTGIEGMGFAIPIEEASSLADTIIRGEDISRPYLGISMLDARDSYYANYYHYEAGTAGVLIPEVVEGSPAAKAGLRPGDIIVGIGDTEIEDVASLRYELYKHKAGETVVIKYLRESKTQTTKVTLQSNN